MTRDEKWAMLEKTLCCFVGCGCDSCGEARQLLAALKQPDAVADTERVDWLIQHADGQKIYMEGIGWMYLTRAEIDMARAALAAKERG